MTGSNDEGVTPPPAPGNPPAERAIVRKPRITGVHDLPSDRYVYEVHGKVLGKLNMMSSGGKQSVKAAEVVGPDVPAQACVLNVKFWVENGFLTAKDNAYTPTQGMINYVLARAASPDKARTALRDLIGGSWFADVARNSLAAKPVMPRKELEGDLSMAVKVPYDHKPTSMSIMVSYLEEAGIVTADDEGNVRIGPGQSAQTPTPMEALMPAGSGTQVLSPRSYTLGQSELPPAQTIPAGWRTLHGPGFLLQFDPSPASLKWIRKHLALLDEEMEEVAAKSNGETKTLDKFDVR